MIIINKPYIIKKNFKSRCICEIEIDNIVHSIWFEVENKYEKYLCIERADAYVIGLLNYALRNNHDINCLVPITEDLKYNILTILIPSLVKYGKNLNFINIIGETAKPLNEGNGVGTGCSCGVDSFSAIKNHLNSEYQNLNLTHLCLNNVGAYNECYSEYGIEKVKEERLKKTREVAKELGIELIETDSNFSEEIHQEHILTHTYSSVFAIYMLQKLWKTYYYASSGEDYSNFSLFNNDLNSSALYELLSLQCFSIPSLKIYSEGGEKVRIDKTKDIVDFKPAQKYLHVCLLKPYNCNDCHKCRRTLTSLDALNKLGNFAEVFDINYYNKNKKKYYRWLYYEHLKHDKMNEPVYQILKHRKEFKKGILFYRPIAWIKRIIPKNIKKIIKSRSK